MRTVGFVSTKPGAVSSAKTRMGEEAGKVLPRDETGEPDLDRGMKGAPGCHRKGGVQAEGMVCAEA